jgi:hypothetical protein
VRGPGKTEEVRSFGLVQLQGLGQRLEHALGRPVGIAALQAGVVVDAHSSQQRDLFAAESGHAPVAAVGGQAGLLGGDPGPPGGQELADLVAVG